MKDDFVGDVDRSGWAWRWVSAFGVTLNSAVIFMTTRRVPPLLPLEHLGELGPVLQVLTRMSLDVISKTNNINGARDDCYKTVVNGIRYVGDHVDDRYD